MFVTSTFGANMFALIHTTGINTSFGCVEYDIRIHHFVK